MNVLPFILAVLLVLSYVTVSRVQTETVSSASERAFLGLRRAERVLLRKAETARFGELPGVPTKLKRERTKGKTLRVAEPMVNPPCARLNLFPLIGEGKQVHSHLYAMALKVLNTFYSDIDAKSVLDAVLEAGQKQLERKETVALETLQLKTPELQAVYYRLLKGTNKCILEKGVGYPALLDYMKIDRASTQVCLYHAHPNMMAPFFGVDNAPILYQKLHTECKPGVEIEAIFHMIDSRNLRFVDPEVWKLVNFTRPQHSRKVGDQVEVAKDPSTGVFIRRKLH